MDIRNQSTEHSIARTLAALPEAERRKVLASLSPEELEGLEYCWPLFARPDQLPPPPPWRTWLMLGGRGSGKTRSAAEYIRGEVESGRHQSIVLVGPTADTLRRDQAEAILRISPSWCRAQHEPSTRRITWQNGAVAYLLSSEEPDRARGINASLCWGDELTSWTYPDEIWANIQMGLRIPGPKGDDPRAVISTTPKRHKLLKQVMASPTTATTRSRTVDNRANLSEATVEFLMSTYGGTSLGRQELDAELLDDVDGALWGRELLDTCRVEHDDKREYRRVVVAVDPSGGSGKNNDECGIIVAGRGADAHGYVLADLSGKLSPERWARRAVDAYHTYKADKIVVEANFGGDMCVATIRGIDARIPVKVLHASRGKAIRAEPVVSLYEQHRVHHVGSLDGLEDQMCSWDPNHSSGSPDRVDAAVWAITELLVTPSGGSVRVQPLLKW
jgi:phage terminase large subunit-like protein